MRTDDSRLLSEHFSTSSLDLTPASVGRAAHLLYAPVSNSPLITKYCASLLADTELERAERFARATDKILFIQRRAFQRFCAALALGSSQPLAKITFSKTENGRPHLPGLPNLWFSFSSCRFGFVGAWSSTHGIGVDIEDQTRDLHATELAQQFFLHAESRVVEGSSGLARQRTFFKFWCLKEAALKSIGEGLPFGLDSFEFELNPKLRMVHAPVEHGGAIGFAAHIIEAVESCIALVMHSRF